MSRPFLFVAIAVALAGIVWLLFRSKNTTPAPLNASGYTYPSSPGA